MEPKPQIAVFAGPTATILNTPRFGEPSLRPQRLAADVELLVEVDTAHPMQSDAADRAAPDGYIDEHGVFSGTEPDAGGKPVRRVVLRSDDGLVPLPWNPGQHAPAQTFYPDASRVYEEIDRLGLDDDGRPLVLGRLAAFSFFRPAPPAGYLHRHPTGDPVEVRGVDFFPYGSESARAEPNTATLARITNVVQETLDAGDFAGAQWLEGSPVVEETLYWLNLLIDTRVPIVGQVAQYMYNTYGADGPRNLVDGVRYIVSRAWADASGADRVGAVLVADGVALAARDFLKVASRPGGYEAAGPGWGAVASLEDGRQISVEYLPTRRHTHESELNLRNLPRSVDGVHTTAGRVGTVSIEVLDEQRRLRAEAIPHVSFVKYGRYGACLGPDDDEAYAVAASVEHALAHHPLAGFVSEGIVPNGWLTRDLEGALAIAAYSGMPVVRCGRGNQRAFAGLPPMPFIGGNNLSANKARILLMAAMLKLGSLPPARDPTAPTPKEVAAVESRVAEYQRVFDTH